MTRVLLIIVGVFLIVGGSGAWLLLDAICVVDSNSTARVLRGDLDPERLRSLQFTPWCEPSAKIQPFASWLESFDKGTIVRYRQATRTDHILIRETYYQAEYVMPDGKTVIGPAVGPMPYTAPNSRVLFAMIAVGVLMVIMATVRSRRIPENGGGPDVGRETTVAPQRDQTSGTGHADRRFWYVPDVVVIAYLFGFITFVHSSYLVWYVGGLHNRAPFMFDPYIMRQMWMMPLAGICLVILCVRLTVTWPAHIRSRKRLWGLCLSVVLGLVAYASLHFVPIPGEYNEPFLLGYRKYARAHVDIPAIRAWLETQDPGTYGGARMILDSLSDEQRASLPRAITSLRPFWIEFFLDSHNHWAIRLDWGHVNADWGVEIGRTDMEIAPVEPRNEPESFYRLPLVPGAYVWHDLH